MDKIDKKIIFELQKNGRLSNFQIADKVGLSPSPCLRRIKNLEKKGVISGYTAIVNEELFGLPIIAFVFELMRSSISLGEMHQLSLSISQNTGLAPVCITTLAQAAKVILGTITSSPDPIFNVLKAK